MVNVAVLGYGFASHLIVNQIKDKSSAIDQQTKVVEAQIQKINSETSTVNSGKSAYNQMYQTLYAINMAESYTCSGT